MPQLFFRRWTAALVLLSGLVAGAAPVSFELKSSVIVIPDPAAPAEQYAARELADFVQAATGARLPVVTEATPMNGAEIRLGAARNGEAESEAYLRPQTPEGYRIHPEGRHLRLCGNTPRGTLYAVYDVLETELGIRFLAPDYTHIPVSDGKITVAERVYDPVFEYRNIYCDPVWAVRNRLNADWDSIPLEEIAGGVKWIGPSFVHTFYHLVPPEEYGATHPEYFSLINGRRVVERSQLCLTNPEVFAIALERIRQWIAEAPKSPDTRYLVSVSGNDWGNICQCPDCNAVNAEEESTAGTLWRFLNRLAERLEPEYPDVALETLAYNWSFEPPARTRPHPRVVVRLAPIDADFARPIHDERFGNAAVIKQLRRWRDWAGKLYVWDYHTNFDAYFSPFPNLYSLTENIRLYSEAGVRGYYAQGTQTPGGEMAPLRFYLAARSMWDPSIDGRATIEEFCRLYYGAEAAPSILAYIDLLHRDFLAQNCRLSIRKTPPCMNFSDEFLREADALLAQAEADAATPEERQRVAVFRLPVWFEMLEKEFTRHGRIAELPLVWQFRPDPDQVGVDEQWYQPESDAITASIRVDAPWTAQQYADFHGTGWYRSEFVIPDAAAGRELALYFGAVDGKCIIYLDGQRIGAQEKPPEMMWNKGFFVDLPAGTRPGKHILSVVVSKDECAAGIWKPVVLMDRQSRLAPEIQEAAERFPVVADAAGVTHMSEFYGRPRAQLEEDFYPRIAALRNRRAVPVHDAEVRFYPSDFSNVHRTFRLENDDTATGGAVIVQNAGNRSLNEAILAELPERLHAAAPAELQYRVRLRVAGLTGREGAVFRFGCRSVEADWSGMILAERTVNAAECAPGWREFILPLPELPPGRKYALYLNAADNAGAFEAVCLDYLEVVRQTP